MNVFEWVDDLCRQLADTGRNDLAQKIWYFAVHAGEHRNELVNSLYPELLAASKSLNLPWLEIYVRHFHVNMRIGMGEGEKAVRDTVQLFELAHRDENRGCPQSVCATQDLVYCYRRIDAPGYAEVCRQAIEETFARIDPSWGCFECLTVEWACILRELGRPQDALAYLAAQRQRIAKSGDSVHSGILYEQARAASLCGKHDEALEFAEELSRRDTSPSELTLTSNAIQWAWVLARAGRLGEAAGRLPDFDKASDAASHFLDWAETTELLIAGGLQANGASIGSAFDSIVRQLEDGGAHYEAMLAAERHVRLSLQRGAHWTAQRAMAAFERARMRLRDPDRALERSHKLQALFEATPLPAAPVPYDQILAFIQGLPDADPNRDTERSIPWLLAACRERPEDVHLQLVTASQLAYRNAIAEADALLTALTKRVPGSENAWYMLLELRVEHNDDAGAERLIAESAAHHPDFPYFAKARLAFKQERFEECIAASEQFLAMTPDAPFTRRRLAFSAQRLGNHRLAAEHFKLLAGSGAEPGSDDWDLLVSATVLNDQALVSQCCERLNLPVEPGTMPAVWKGGGLDLCSIVYKDAHGRLVPQWAERIGPVSARIIEVESPDTGQCHGDLVVFDARYLKARPEEPEKAETWFPEFLHQHTQKKGNYRSWLVDGVFPGREIWEQFRARLKEREWGLWVRSGEAYRVIDSANQDAELPGVLAFVAAPDATPPATVAEVLTRLTREWPHPLCWLALAEAAQHEAGRHAEIKRRYQL